MKEIVLTIHIIVASFWIGGMLFMVLVLSPYIRKLPDSITAYKEVGRRYSRIGTVIGLPLLFITGIINMKNMGFSIHELISPSNNYTFTLQHKVLLFLITFLLALIHDFYLGEKSHESEKLRKITRIVGVLNLIIGIAIIYLATILRFGG